MSRDVTGELILSILILPDYQTHDPTDGWATGSRVGGKLREDERTIPSRLPVLSHRAKQLASLESY